MLRCNVIKSIVKIIYYPRNISSDRTRGIALAFPGFRGHRRSVGHVRERGHDGIYSAK